MADRLAARDPRRDPAAGRAPGSARTTSTAWRRPTRPSLTTAGRTRAPRGRADEPARPRPPRKRPLDSRAGPLAQPRWRERIRRGRRRFAPVSPGSCSAFSGRPPPLFAARRIALHARALGARRRRRARRRALARPDRRPLAPSRAQRSELLGGHRRQRDPGDRQRRAPRSSRARSHPAGPPRRRRRSCARRRASRPSLASGRSPIRKTSSAITPARGDRDGRRLRAGAGRRGRAPRRRTRRAPAARSRVARRHPGLQSARLRRGELEGGHQLRGEQADRRRQAGPGKQPDQPGLAHALDPLGRPASRGRRERPRRRRAAAPGPPAELSADLPAAGARR